MPEHYTAFLSYAHCYQAWVEVLHRGLEAGLAAASRPGKVFLDETDLASGRSWIGQLQAGLDRAGQLILVITPEALASPRVSDEWQSFPATRQDWHEGKLHLVHLVETPRRGLGGEPRGGRAGPGRRPWTPARGAAGSAPAGSRPRPARSLAAPGGRRPRPGAR